MDLGPLCTERHGGHQPGRRQVPAGRVRGEGDPRDPRPPLGCARQARGLQARPLQGVSVWRHFGFLVTVYLWEARPARHSG